MRRRWSPPERGGSTKTVSGRLSSFAIGCITPSGTAAPSRKTASWLPPNFVFVKTSRSAYSYLIASARSSSHLDRRAHVGHERVEDGLLVAQALRALGVVLIGADRQRLVREPLHRAVVQVARTDLESALLRDRRFVHLKFMVLAGDGHPARSEVHDGVIGAVMPEGQPRRRRADRATDELMAETDAEHRELPRRAALERRVEQQLDVLRDLRDRSRIAGSVGDDDAVRRPLHHVARGGRRGEHLHRRAASHQAADLVLLHAGVHERDLGAAARLPREPGRLDDQRASRERRGCPCLRDRLLRDAGVVREVRRYLKERAAKRALRPQAPDERTRVDASNAGYTELPEVRIEVERVLAAGRLELAHHERLD